MHGSAPSGSPSKSGLHHMPEQLYAVGPPASLPAAHEVVRGGGEAGVALALAAVREEAEPEAAAAAAAASATTSRGAIALAAAASVSPATTRGAKHRVRRLDASLPSRAATDLSIGSRSTTCSVDRRLLSLCQAPMGRRALGNGAQRGDTPERS